MAAPLKASSRAQAPRSAPGSSDFLFEMIVCDVQSSALEIAELAMMLTASVRSNANWTLRSLRYLLLDDAKCMLLALRYGPDIGLDNDASGQLSRLYSEVAEAKKRLAPLAAADTPSVRAEVTECAAAWRGLANQASAVLDRLEAQVKARLAEIYVEDAATLRPFLTLAARGDIANVDKNGVIHLPELRQRRRTPRLAVNEACSLILPTGAYSARLIDISRQGLGIFVHCPVAERDEVTVALADGRRLEAIVIRRTGANVGLQLKRPLAATDPLFGK